MPPVSALRSLATPLAFALTLIVASFSTTLPASAATDVPRLSDYNNEKLVITSAKPKGSNQAIVESQINFTNGREPVKVTWWLVKDASGAYKIFDVNVVGIWLAQEQRSSFTSVIANNGDNFDALLGHLRQQIQTAAAQ